MYTNISSNQEYDTESDSIVRIVAGLRRGEIGTPLAKQIESVFMLMPREIKNHPKGPRDPAEMVGKLLASTMEASSSTSTRLESLGRMLTVKEAAALLGCCPKTIFLKIKAGKLQSLKSDRVVRIPEAAIVSLVNSERKEAF